MQRSKKFVSDYLAELSQGDNLCRVHNISGISLCLCIVQPSLNQPRRPRASKSGWDKEISGKIGSSESLQVGRHYMQTLVGSDFVRDFFVLFRL